MSGAERRRRLVATAVGIACVLPIAYLLLLSLAGRWPYPAPLPDGVRWGPWSDIFSEGSELGASFLLSALLSTAVALLATGCGFMASRFVAYHGRRRALLFLAYLPFAMSPVILGTCIHVLYLRIGLAGSTIGVICAQLIFTLGFGVIFFNSFWNDERRALEDMAVALGGTPLQIYRKVLLPIAREMLLLCFLQTFLLSWFQYGITLLIGAGTVKTLPLLVFAYIGEANTSYSAASGMLLILPPILMLWANRRFLYRYI